MVRFGRYELGRILGEGGAGRVYEAVLVGPGGFRKPVALKVLHDGTDAVRREARIGGLLRHRHLVDVYEVGEVDGLWFCAMERCDGALMEHLPLPPRAVVEVGLQVCSALGYAHRELGLVHLDLKPPNLFLAGPEVKVGDLGIARAAGFGGDGRIRGTRGYMAPEQAAGLPVDHRADQYALGRTLLELATGALPEAARTLDATWEDEPSLRDPLPIWLLPAVDRCLAADPADRWESMEALASALAALEPDGPGLREAIGWTADVRVAPPRVQLGAALVGRSAERTAIRARLARGGVTTLKGPAGIGKSALAAAIVSEWSAGGGTAWLCELAAVRELDELVSAVARALGLPLAGADSAAHRRQIGRSLAGRGAVVLALDTFEQIAAHAEVVADWSAAAPEARILVTSRQALGLPEEVQLEVGPLEREASVKLLRARARERGVELEASPELEELAERLDGVPLALELAAGRLGVLSVREILDRLGLSLLRSAGADRHGTLHAALDWSWALLGASEREALSRLSVFRGPLAIEAAEAVVGAASILELLDALVHRSMVRARPDGRFELLEIVRAFAGEHLDDPEAELRHGRHYASLGSSEVLLHLRSAAAIPRFHEVASDLPNLLIACRRAIARGDPEVAASTLALAWSVLSVRGPYSAVVPLAEAVVALPRLTGPARLEALRVAGAVQHRAGELERARRHFEALGEQAAAQGDRRAEAVGLGMAGSVADRLGDASGLDAMVRGRALHRAVGDRIAEGSCLSGIGAAWIRRGELGRAREAYAEALGVLREGDDLHNVGAVLCNLAILDSLEDLRDSARVHYAAALDRARRTGDLRLEVSVAHNLGVLLGQEGQLDAAIDSLERARQVGSELGDRNVLAGTLCALGPLLHELGRADEGRERLREGIAVATEVSNERIRLNGLAFLARIELEEGECAAALARYDRVLAAVGAADDPGRVATWRSARALALAGTGRLDEALEACAQAVQAVRERGQPADRVEVLADAARVEAQAGWVERARERLAEARRSLPQGRPSLTHLLERAERAVSSAEPP